ncbi:hypothetical protein EYZ11_002665 [Aspergillus tanneri]|nr:hypothetical protein EYZ11_002665 [Aspergillus tanneri]
MDGVMQLCHTYPPLSTEAGGRLWIESQASGLHVEFGSGEERGGWNAYQNYGAFRCGVDLWTTKDIVPWENRVGFGSLVQNGAAPRRPPKWQVLRRSSV